MSYPHKWSKRQCKQCKKQFERLTSFMKKRNPRFCSNGCARRHQVGRPNPQVRGREKERKGCEQCGVEFVVRPGNANRFCSKPCMVLGNRGPKSPNWRGGRFVDANGYAWIRKMDHPRAKGHGGYVKEHHVVMEEKLGRLLLKGETVHHINGSRADNRPENLQLRQGRHGNGVAYVCADCGSLNVVNAPIGTD